jgi:glycerol uptake facilitator-like aquaporin
MRPEVLARIAASSGHMISGAHLNPAVTLCMVAMKAQSRRSAAG